MSQAVLALFLSGISFFAAANASPTQHHCYRTARAIALNVIKKNSNHKDLVEKELTLKDCKIGSHKVECFAGKSLTILEFEPSLDVERLSPAREDLDFAFWADTRGIDIGVEISLISTPNHPCKYNASAFFVEPNGKE